MDRQHVGSENGLCQANAWQSWEIDVEGRHMAEWEVPQAVSPT